VTNRRTLSPFVILSVAKNLVLYVGVTPFLMEIFTRRKGLLGCWGTRFFAALRMTKGERVPKFDGLTTHLILRCAQNDKGGAWLPLFNFPYSHLVLNVRNNDNGGAWSLFLPHCGLCDSPTIDHSLIDKAPPLGYNLLMVREACGGAVACSEMMKVTTSFPPGCPIIYI
jgi:hypothetical protein